jgi:hypothetical protein
MHPSLKLKYLHLSVKYTQQCIINKKIEIKIIARYINQNKYNNVTIKKI